MFVAARGLSLVVASGGYSLLWCAGFSLQWLLLLWSTGSRRAGSVVEACGLSSCGSRALKHRLSSCSTRAWLLRGVWDLPGPGLEPMSPALAGGFLTTEPPGKSLCFSLWLWFIVLSHCSLFSSTSPNTWWKTKLPIAHVFTITVL